jgi:hypothetical protein
VSLLMRWSIDLVNSEKIFIRFDSSISNVRKELNNNAKFIVLYLLTGHKYSQNSLKDMSSIFYDCIVFEYAIDRVF